MTALVQQRRDRLFGALGVAKIDLLVAYGNSWQADYLRYATGFALLEGHGLALVRPDGSVRLFLESAIEVERAQEETSGIEIALVPDAAAAVLAELRAAKGARIAGAPRHLLASRLTDPANGVEIGDATAVIDTLLMRKLPAELDAIRRSTHLADDAYKVFMQAAVVGRCQYELVADVEAYLRSRGSPENFQIIGSGGVEVKAMAPPSERRLEVGDLVTTELTPETEGYYAQICRTLVVGKASDAQKKAFAVYREALAAGIAAVKPGALASDVAKAENDVFGTYGLREYTTNLYTRVRGHGVGLFCDSKPHILEDVDVEIVPGMAFVVHPNTYHPEVGYIVLGDTVIVTETGVEVVTQTPRELFEVAA